MRLPPRFAVLPAILAAAVMCMAAASDPAERLPNPAQESRARNLFSEVRCMMCQNESIDDSEAEIAYDLRMSIRRQVAEGKSDAEIRKFLVSRFGQFVMLKPAFSWENAALWSVPVVVLLAGGGLLTALLRRRVPGDDLPADALSPEEEAKVQAILADDPLPPA